MTVGTSTGMSLTLLPPQRPPPRVASGCRVGGARWEPSLASSVFAMVPIRLISRFQGFSKCRLIREIGVGVSWWG